MTRHDDITAGLRKVNVEGQGVMRVTFVWPADLPELLVASFLGDDEATFEARVVAEGLRGVRAIETLCLLCDAVPKAEEVAMVCAMHAAVPNPALGMIFVLCHTCAARPRPALVSAVETKITDSITGIKRIDVHPEGGNA